MKKSHSETAIIRIHCPDQKGLVARITDFIHRNNGNIVALDQHTDRDEGRFFMRVEWELHDFEIMAVLPADDAHVVGELVEHLPADAAGPRLRAGARDRDRDEVIRAGGQRV